MCWCDFDVIRITGRGVAWVGRFDAGFGDPFSLSFCFPCFSWASQLPWRWLFRLAHVAPVFWRRSAGMWRPGSCGGEAEGQDLAMAGQLDFCSFSCTHHRHRLSPAAGDAPTWAGVWGDGVGDVVGGGLQHGREGGWGLWHQRFHHRQAFDAGLTTRIVLFFC